MRTYEFYTHIAIIRLTSARRSATSQGNYHSNIIIGSCVAVVVFFVLHNNSTLSPFKVHSFSILQSPGRLFYRVSLHILGLAPHTISMELPLNVNNINAYLAHKSSLVRYSWVTYWRSCIVVPNAFSIPAFFRQKFQLRWRRERMKNKNEPGRFWNSY